MGEKLLVLRLEEKLTLLENKVPAGIFGLRRQELTRG
jgi:hypothetical protein